MNNAAAKPDMRSSTVVTPPPSSSFVEAIC